MKKNPPQIIINFLWIALWLGVSFLLAVLLFGWAFVQAALTPWLRLSSICLVVALIVTRIRVFKKATKFTAD